MAFLSRGLMLGASHGIGHMIRPFGVGHGETNCILTSAVYKYNAEPGGEKVIQRQKTALDNIWADPFVCEI